MKKYSQEFKQEAVQLVTQQGYTMSQAAKSLGIRANMIWRWKKAIIENDEVTKKGNGNAVEPPELELRRLREEVRRLRMEREILKKAAVFFAKENE